MRSARGSLRISDGEGVGHRRDPTHRNGRGKRKRPGRRCGLSPARLPGLLEWTGPPLVDGRALAFVSTCSHRPSRLAARRAMPRVGLDTGFPVSNPWHRFTLTRLPEPSVLAPFGTDFAESSWGGPSSFGSSTTTPLPAHRPKALCHLPPEGVRSPATRRRWACPVVSPHRSPAAGCPVPFERSSRSPSPSPPEGRAGPV